MPPVPSCAGDVRPPREMYDLRETYDLPPELPREMYDLPPELPREMYDLGEM